MMALYCSACGKELAPGTERCPFCGDAIDPTPVVLKKEARKKKKIWLLVAAAVLLILPAAVLWLGNGPEARLSKAAANTLGSLQTRLSGTPFGELDLPGWSEGVTTTVDLELSMGFLLNAEVSTETVMDFGSGNRYSGMQFDLFGMESVTQRYAGPGCAVMGSPEKGYHGVTFDSLEQDLAASPAFADAKPGEPEAFREMAEAMRPAAMPEDMDLPGAAKQLLREVRLQKGRGSCEINGTVQKVDTVSAALSNRQLANILDALAACSAGSADAAQALGMDAGGAAGWLQETARELRAAEEGSCLVEFFLRDDLIAGLSLTLQQQENFSLLLLFGADPAVDDIILRTASSDPEEAAETEAVLSTKIEGEMCREQLRLKQTDHAGTESETCLSYAWNRENGDLEIVISGESDYTLNGTLQATPQHLRLQLPRVQELLAAGAGERSALLGLMEIALDMEMKAGGEVVIPAYENLDQWEENYFANDFLLRLEDLF